MADEIVVETETQEQRSARAREIMSQSGIDGLRIVFGLHATWAVNSATHMFGSRRFEIRDDSRNTWWVALISFGEGWHNNHHAHPVSARHGLKWYEIDLNWYGIWTLKKLGLARHVYRVKLDELREQERAQIGADESAAAVTAQAELAST